MANPWLEKLKAYKTTHNTDTTLTREGTREAKTPDTPEKVLDKIDKIASCYNHEHLIS